MQDERNRVKATKATANALLNDVRQYMDDNGYLSWSERDKKYILLGTNSSKSGLVDCPECAIGRIIMVRSKSTGKRFLGCTNYANGCTASSPLLQKARLRVIKTTCDICRWPIVIFRYSRNQKWSRKCSNINCASHKVI